MPASWNWDEFNSEDGVIHASQSNTDNDDSTLLRKGYDYVNFPEITPDPTECYPMHEDSGTTMYDLAGSKNGSYTDGGSLTVNASGPIGYSSIDFDGSSDNKNYADVSSFSFPSGSGWTAFIAVYPRETESSGTSNGVGWGIQIDSNNNVQMQHSGGNDWNANWSNSGNSYTQSYTADRWYVWCVQCDNAGSGSSTVNVYWDGSQVVNNTGKDTVEGSAQLVIGNHRRISSNNSPWHGKIGEFRMYDNFLSQSEVQTVSDIIKASSSWTSTTKTL